MGNNRSDNTQPQDKSGKVRSRVARHLQKLLIPGVMGMGACNKCGETAEVD